MVQKLQKMKIWCKTPSFLVIFGPLKPLLKFFEHFLINFLAFLKILIPIFWKSVKNSVHSNFLKCWLFIDQLSAYRYKHDVPQKLQSHIDRNKELLWTEFCTDFQNIGIKIFRKARRLIKKYSKNFRRGLRGPKMTKNEIFFTKFSYFCHFWTFLLYFFKFLYFFRIVEFISNILVPYLLKLNKNWIFHNSFSIKNIEIYFFCPTAKNGYNSKSIPASAS